MPSDQKTAWEEFYSAFKDRVSSPISGTFILAWILHNWKAVMPLIYGDSSVEVRVTAVDAALRSSGNNAWQAPLCFTIVYLIATPLIRYVYAIFISKIDFSLLHSKIRKDLELEELKQYHFTLKQICEQLKHLLLGQQKLAESGKTILKEILTGRPIDRNHKHLLSYLNKITGPLDVLIPALEKFNAVEGSPTQLIENFTNRWQKTNELADGKVVKALESKKTDHPE